MAKFKDLSKSDKLSDRSAGDRLSHRLAVRQAIKGNLPGMVRELDLFKVDKISGKKYKIPVKLMEEFMLIFDETRGKDKSSGVGQKANARKGQVVGKVSEKMNKKLETGDRAGKEPGEMVLELTAEDLDFVLDEISRDLNLPFLSSDKRRRIKVKKQNRWRGVKENGIEPRFDLENSYVEKIKREKMSQDGEEKSFIQDDLRYHGLGIKKERRTNVLIMGTMDISGSMGDEKKYWAKAFLYALYWLTKTKYENAEIIFIAHHTEAQETDSYTFFHLSSSGGTRISSGPLKNIEIIKKRYPPQLWDIYAVHCSDGENDSDDGWKTIRAFRDLLKLCKLVGFIEIKPGVSRLSSTSQELAAAIKNKEFRILLISKKEDIRKKLEQFLDPDLDLSRRLANACAS